jgi:hypothetical protein
VNGATEVIDNLPRDAARMLAVEILLAEPEALGDDVLESSLYILREKLRVSANHKIVDRWPHPDGASGPL